MRALHLGLRVTDLDGSLAFYRAVGYEVIGDVPDTDIGHLTMLKLPLSASSATSSSTSPQPVPTSDVSLRQWRAR